MIVTASATAVTLWASASHQPAKMIHMIFPMIEATPASDLLTSCRPKGHREKSAIRNDARPNGIVAIRMQQMIPARD